MRLCAGEAPRVGVPVARVDEDVEPQSQATRRMVAERRAFRGLRDGEEMPVICPTCQPAFDASMPAAGTFAWGCFRNFGSDLHRLAFAPTQSGALGAAAFRAARWLRDIRMARARLNV
jgi:hypothetical protein